MEFVRFDIPVGATEPDHVGAFCHSFLMSQGVGSFTIRSVHMTAAAEGDYRASLAEKSCDCDYLFVMLKGAGAVSANHRKGEAPIRPGQAVLFPAEEGYVIYADEELLGLMIGARPLSLIAGIDDRPIPYVPVNIFSPRRREPPAPPAPSIPPPEKPSWLQRFLGRDNGLNS